MKLRDLRNYFDDNGVGMLEKVISGAQTGADRAGLRAAKAAGLKTGGYMPLGYIALDGNLPEFESMYNIKQHTSPKYPPRTYANVRESDATVRFAAKFDSPGEVCTMNAILKYKKPYFDVNVRQENDPYILVKWLKENNVSVLNVAGNTEKTSPGIEKYVFEYLTEVFKSIISK